MTEEVSESPLGYQRLLCSRPEAYWQKGPRPVTLGQEFVVGCRSQGEEVERDEMVQVPEEVEPCFLSCKEQRGGEG